MLAAPAVLLRPLCSVLSRLWRSVWPPDARRQTTRTGRHHHHALSDGPALRVCLLRVGRVCVRCGGGGAPSSVSQQSAVGARDQRPEREICDMRYAPRHQRSTTSSQPAGRQALARTSTQAPREGDERTAAARRSQKPEASRLQKVCVCVCRDDDDASGKVGSL
jgi:hypothetical protein